MQAHTELELGMDIDQRGRTYGKILVFITKNVLAYASVGS